MPRRSLKGCSTPGCENLVTGGRCPECRSRKDRDRGSPSQRGYGARWRVIRDRYLEEHPFCDEPECEAMATDVDHEPPRVELVAAGVPDPDDPQYLSGKCHSHHSRKTALQNQLGRR